MHAEMAAAVVYSPITFFETTPIGRILNRFTQDMRTVDNALPRVFTALLSSIIRAIFTLVLIGYSMPPFVIIMGLLTFIYSYYQRYYVVTIRDLKRLSSVSKSPILAHVEESLEGSESLRAFNHSDRFAARNVANIDANAIANYASKSTNRWLSTRLQFIGSLVTLSTAILAVIYRGNIPAALVALVMSYAIRVTASLNFIVRKSVEIESDVVCCERIFEYTRLPAEPSLEPEYQTPLPVPPSWPEKGEIVFQNYTAKYYGTTNTPVLRDINLHIKPGDKIGVVGRTGAGKSSLLLALFRALERVCGEIAVDSLPTGGVPLHTLRARLALIPQESRCLPGTLRRNLDPLGVHTDDTVLWEALEAAQLGDRMRALAETQQVPPSVDKIHLGKGAGDLSAGERQLLSLARALLRVKDGARVLVLDEATASVDAETDRAVQEALRSACTGVTVITVAHRLHTVANADRIVVLAEGAVIEEGPPSVLLKRADSAFARMWRGEGV